MLATSCYSHSRRLLPVPSVHKMLSLLNILQLELHVFPAAFALLFLLPFSSNARLRYYGCYAVYVIAVSIISFIYLPVVLCRPKNVRNSVLLGYAVRQINRLLGLGWEVRHGEELQVDRGAVIVANHQSSLDILGMFSFWELMGKCAAVARKELLYMWPFGLAAWASGTVFIDRKQARQAYSKLDEASLLVTKHKAKLWMFPEGTRNSKDKMLPFKVGAFRVAIGCQAPIIPVVFSPYHFIDHEQKNFGRGKIVVQVLDAIPTKGKTENDMSALMEETRVKMEAALEKLKQEVLRDVEVKSKKTQ